MKILNAGDSVALFQTSGAADSASTYAYNTIKVNPGCKLSIVSSIRSSSGFATYPDGIAYIYGSVDNVYWYALAEVNLQELSNTIAGNMENGEMVFWATDAVPLNLSTNYIRIEPLTQLNAGVDTNFAIKIGG